MSSFGKKIVIASNNAGKIREFNTLFQPHDIDVLPQASLNIDETDEPYHTFIENALTKARHASRRSGLPALADDSGICIKALNGEPGVHSARYAGEPKSDERNNQKLITALAGCSDRRAYYYCIIVLVRHVDDPQPVIVDGIWHGTITHKPQGQEGFGYDPYFLVPNLDKTAAELSAEHKNQISHRGIALSKLLIECT